MTFLSIYYPFIFDFVITLRRKDVNQTLDGAVLPEPAGTRTNYNIKENDQHLSIYLSIYRENLNFNTRFYYYYYFETPGCIYNS